MTVMTPEWAKELKEGPKRRLQKVKDTLGIKPGQGYRVRYLGTFMMTDQKIYYAYQIFHKDDKNYKTGLNRYAFLDLDTEEYRGPIGNEILMMMQKEIPMLYID